MKIKATENYFEGNPSEVSIVYPNPPETFTAAEVIYPGDCVEIAEGKAVRAKSIDTASHVAISGSQPEQNSEYVPFRKGASNGPST